MNEDLFPIITQIKEAPREYRPDIIRAVFDAYGPESILVEKYNYGKVGKGNPFTRMFPSDKLPVYSQPPMIWFGIYRGGVTHMPGQTGAGKSTLFYNIADGAASGKLLYGIPFPEHGLRVLYIDPENNGWIRANKVERLGAYHPNLFFHDGVGIDLSDEAQIDYLLDTIHENGIDIVIADPRTNLFPSNDENNNSEGAKEYSRLVDIASQTNVAFLLADHTGKSEENWMGRGSSSRAGMAHVIMTFTVKKKDEGENDDYDPDNPRPRTDITRLKIHKDRFLGIDASIYLQMVGGDKFERASFEDWCNFGNGEDGGRETACIRAKEAVLQFLTDRGIGKVIPASEIVKALNIAGHTRNTVYTGISKLEQESKITRVAIDGRSHGYRIGSESNATGLPLEFNIPSQRQPLQRRAS